MEVKENEKIDKTLDLARGLKKLSNMKETVLQIVVGGLYAVPNALEKILVDLEGLKPSRSQHCKNRLENLDESWTLENISCHLDSSERKPVKTDVISEILIIIIIANAAN